MVTTLGSFEVNLTPQSDEACEAGRLLIEKTYQGGLEGKGTGQMLSARTEQDGSAGYVAIERFSGTLDGRSGSFVLQHVGLMNRGSSTLQITVIPDSEC